MSLICTVPALPGTPLHRPSAGPRLHRPAGHWIPAAGAAAGACPGHLPPSLPAPAPGRLPSTLQPSPLQAPAHPTAEANPGLTGVPGCSHTGKGLGLRCVESRILSIVLLVTKGLEASPGLFCPVLLLTTLPESGPSIPWTAQHHLWTQCWRKSPCPRKSHGILNLWAGPCTFSFPLLA